MAKSTSRVTGNDKVADPGGTRPAKKAAGTGSTKPTTRAKVKSGDRNVTPAKHETRIKK